MSEVTEVIGCQDINENLTTCLRQVEGPRTHSPSGTAVLLEVEWLYLASVETSKRRCEA